MPPLGPEKIKDDMKVPKYDINNELLQLFPIKSSNRFMKNYANPHKSTGVFGKFFGKLKRSSGIRFRALFGMHSLRDQSPNEYKVTS